SVARELSRYKLRIAVLEKEIEPAFGVSKSNSGIIHPGTQNHFQSLKGRLCVRGNELTRVIAGELGVDFKEVGELIVAFSEDDLNRLMQIKRDAEMLGVPRLEIVGRGWLVRNEPNLSRDAVAALYAPTAGIISPYRLVYDLCENAEKNGVEFYPGHAVSAVHRRNSSPRGFEIVTSRGVFGSRFLINCAGLFADEIAGMAGIFDFKIHPRKGEEFILDKKKRNMTRYLLFPVPSGNSKGILVIKTADGNPMIGPTADDTGDKYDLSTSDEGFRKVLSGVKKMVPSIDGSDIIAYFAGLRPVAGDDFIIRHENSFPGLVTVAGIQSPGLTCAPAIALLAVDILKKHGLGLRKKSVFYAHRRKTRHLFAMPLAQAKNLIKKDRAYGDIVCRCEMVSAQEVREAVERGAKTLDGIKFRTRAQAGRCHGSFCTTRIMKILAEESGIAVTAVTKRGEGTEIVKGGREEQG
ncbi:MAG: NAD(P)/FAD-dependent oxidoreductase, partial [Candidatus Omnitrophica bacterium]|nr:NAD(P)/FAD-dependent oxidoreductase [Candidatus Omnitrophota bacterium]